MIERGGVKRLKKVYDEAQHELERKLAALAGSSGSSFTAHQHRAMLAQLRQGQAEIARRLAAALNTSTKQAQVEGLHGLIRDLARLEGKFGGGAITIPIEEASRFAGIIDASRTSVLAKMQKKAISTYTTGMIKSMESALAQSLIQGETTGDAIDRVQKIASNKWWQAARIVRTEQTWAYNATHAEAMKEASGDIPDLWMRWTEYVSDTTGAKLDDRVGDDSVVMHGQLAKPGDDFTMPNDSRVSPSLRGKSWSHPPNRPNDRAVLQPWRPHWGIPGWVLRGGRRVPLQSRP